MSSSATSPSNPKKSASGVDNTQNNASPSNKGKSKAKHEIAEDEEEEDEEEETGSEEESSSEEVEDDLGDIDPAVIMSQGRRTRGVKVDYTSKEALEKAGLQGNEDDESDDDDDAMKD